MGLIKEPEGVDFIIKSEPLTREQEAELSKFIAKRKQEIAEIEKHERPTKAKSKRAKAAKTKRKSQQSI